MQAGRKGPNSTLICSANLPRSSMAGAFLRPCGSDEQIFGVNEQNPPRDQATEWSLRPTMWVVPTTQSERTPASHVSPCGRGLYLGFNEQMFGAVEQAFGRRRRHLIRSIRPYVM